MKYIFAITTQDVQLRAKRKLGRKLTIEELERVKKGVEFGLELSWEDVVYVAIDEVEEERKRSTKSDRI